MNNNDASSGKDADAPPGSEYPDMDAIRDAHNAPRPDVKQTFGSAVVDAFRDSMHIDYEKWHDGIGYDLSTLESATEADKKLIGSMLASPSGWRDIEALAALDTDAARATLKKAIHSSNAEVRAAVLRYAPSVATDEERTTLLVKALQHGAFYGDLTSALSTVAEFHPPRVVNALFRGLFVRPGDIATHFAAMLAFIHGKATSDFDWNLRPLFLKFNSDDGAERRAAFVELCALLEIDPEQTRATIGDHNED